MRSTKTLLPADPPPHGHQFELRGSASPAANPQTCPQPVRADYPAKGRSVDGSLPPVDQWVQRARSGTTSIGMAAPSAGTSPAQPPRMSDPDPFILKPAVPLPVDESPK